MLMEKMASDIALAAELKLYKIAAEGEKEVKKPKAPKMPKAPAPAKTPKAAQPPKSNGGVKPPMSAEEERALKGRMLNNISDIGHSDIPDFMGRSLAGAGMIPPGLSDVAARMGARFAQPMQAIEYAGKGVMPDTDAAARIFGESVATDGLPRTAYGDMNAALQNAMANQRDNDYRDKIKNLLGFDF